ncbi:SET and MYND domain-containing protein 4-like protein [Leptotrombidium deliense]|uniref:Protein-lysine N-methyltransferase SMYD4 n=1 Tax=Leptotrombidium deliense TaxID=299467 RepID=A0A443SGN5_9ACAR|nr:SET and MYND domain-containing protein 4-like protein [Leptotrombidium deliense]
MRETDFTWVRFHDLISRLISSANEAMSYEFLALAHDFNGLQNNYHRMEFCLQNHALIRAVNNFTNSMLQKLEFCGKSVDKAHQLRLSGNDLFKERKFSDAALMYTRALMNAPHTDATSQSVQEIGLCYGNRSAALFHLKYYTQAIEDINEALKYSNDDSQKKLLSRKLECFINLKNAREANLLLESHREIFSESQKSFKERINSIGGETVAKQNIDSPRMISENSQISGARKGIAVKFSENKGRHIVSTSDINVNEMLVVEKPYSWCLDESLFLYRCQQCLKQLNYSGLPCFGCNEVLFCSAACRENAEVYHKNECNYSLNALSSMGVGYLVLRTLLTAKVENMCNQVNSVNKKVNEVDSYYETNYNAVFKLGNHESDHQCDENFQFAIASLLILNVYEKKLSEKLTDLNRKQLAIAILHHCQQLNTNVITIHSQDISNTLEYEVMEKRIGFGLYPIISLFNHSCQPNTVAFHSGSEITIKTSRKVKAGDELYFCYGPSVAGMSYKDRQAALKSQYYFDCDCVACISRVENKRRAFKCPKCNGALIINEDSTNECITCKSVNVEVSELLSKVEESRNLATEGRKLLSEENYDDAVVKLSFSNKIKEKYLFRINDELKDIKSDLCTCVAMLQHYDVAFQYCKQVLSITKEVFGEQSVEAAQVLIKMVSLKLRAIEDLFDEDESSAVSEARNFLPFVDSAIEKFKVLDTVCDNVDYSAFSSEIEFLQKNRQRLICFL